MKITALGRQQTFAHVSSIHAAAGAGNDSILVKEGVLSPVFLDGGSGDDQLSYFGSGAATLTGGSGDDYLEVGPDITSATLDGGDGNDFLQSDVTLANPVGVTLIGGGGTDTIIGGAGADTIWGDQQGGVEVTSGTADHVDAGDDINGGGGHDTINAGGGDDLIKIGMPGTDTIPLINGGSGSDILAITASNNADNLTVTGASHQVHIAQTNGTGRINATSIEELDIDLGAGADTLTINPVSGSDVTLLSVDLGQVVTDTGQSQLVDDPDNPNGKVKQEIYTVAPDSAGDRVIVRAARATTTSP